jgi:hypothetical protein
MGTLRNKEPSRKFRLRPDENSRLRSYIFQNFPVAIGNTPKISRLRSDFPRLRSEISHLRSEQSWLRSEQSRLRSEQSRLRSEQSEQSS